ncbi:MAG: signal peptide peptidase SppA [Muribaculaceae bacterium]|nr:signal peptide peptidase SppA [Muribaculaceae bacterium]
MKEFWKTALGSFVGAFAAIGVFSIFTCFFVFVGIIGLVITATSKSMNSEETKINDNSVLVLNLEGSIEERKANDDIDFQALLLDQEIPQTYSLQDMIDVVKEAKDNNKIKGIYLKCNGISAGPATAYSFREALSDFKESGKWIYSYAPVGAYSTLDYYFASLSDSIFINPEGEVDLHGFMSVVPYFKNLLDKLGIQVQVFKVGTFKSAVEPYILDKMSDANREQTELYLGNMWNTFAGQIAESRGIELARINQSADSMLVCRDTDYLLANKFVDGTCYEFNFDDKVKALLDIDEDDDVDYVSFNQVKNSIKADKGNKKNKISILYAVGEINSSAKEGIVADNLIPLILDAADDDDIKGLVLRVNSPGGSAYDSEQIWAALEKYKESGKPLAVSMGDYAASGGYYISCGADRIFAEPLTLTGSIGIFGMVPNLKGTLDKVGVNLQYVTTNKNVEMSIFDPLNPVQSQAMQKMVNRGYELFTSRCATGRDLPIDSLKMIAEGRVWDGTEALKNGLVDELGSLHDAIEWVASEAGVAGSYSVTVLPKPQEWYEVILKEYEKRMMVKVFGNVLDETFDYRNTIKSIISQDPIQAREYIEVNL